MQMSDGVMSHDVKRSEFSVGERELCAFFFLLSRPFTYTIPRRTEEMKKKKHRRALLTIRGIFERLVITFHPTEGGSCCNAAA